jgi:two-component system sensor histidine kinase HydH
MVRAVRPLSAYAFAVSSGESGESGERTRRLNEQRQRRRSWWVAGGAMGMAILAALALAVTVLLAQHALDNAADVLIRGDGEAIAAGVVVDIWEVAWPLTAAELTPILAKHEADGLRYVAVVDRENHHVLASAGSAAISEPSSLPRDLLRQGCRTRLVALIPPPWETRAVPPGGKWLNVPNPRPHLVVEFEPPLLRQLQKDLRWTSIVGAAAAIVLIAFALALSLATRRLAEVEQQAEGERRLVALGRASAVIAHELRNPLTALKGHAQLLVEDLQEPSKAKAERVVEGAERLERLTNVLLDFVRDGPLDVRAATPTELVDRALADLPRERVQVDLAAAPKTLQLDLVRTSLALRNLLLNALQATPEEAKPVEVSVTTAAQDLVIEVRDHGPGLAPGAEAQIFDPFVTTKIRGTGLGLSIARRIAEQQSGTITGATHLNGGAVFRIVLPFAPKAS